MRSNDIYEGGDFLDDKYMIIRNDPLNIRNGIVMRRFANEEDIRTDLDEWFYNIEFGKIMDNYFEDDTCNWHIGWGIKR